MAILVDVRPESLLSESRVNEVITCTYIQAIALKELGAPQGNSFFQWYPFPLPYCLTSYFIGEHLRNLSAEEEKHRADAYTIQELYNILPKALSRKHVEYLYDQEYAVPKPNALATVALTEVIIGYFRGNNIKFKK